MVSDPLLGISVVVALFTVASKRWWGASDRLSVLVVLLFIQVGFLDAPSHIYIRL